MAQKTDYFQIVGGIVAKYFLKDIGELSPATDLAKDLGAKSVVLMQIMSAIEDEFDITLNFMQFKRQKTLGEVVEYVKETDED